MDTEVLKLIVTFFVGLEKLGFVIKGLLEVKREIT